MLVDIKTILGVPMGIEYDPGPQTVIENSVYTFPLLAKKVRTVPGGTVLPAVTTQFPEPPCGVIVKPGAP
jgi:hypothetical protein